MNQVETMLSVVAGVVHCLQVLIFWNTRDGTYVEQTPSVVTLHRVVSKYHHPYMQQ